MSNKKITITRKEEVTKEYTVYLEELDKFDNGNNLLDLYNDLKTEDLNKLNKNNIYKYIIENNCIENSTVLSKYNIDTNFNIDTTINELEKNKKEILLTLNLNIEYGNGIFYKYTLTESLSGVLSYYVTVDSFLECLKLQNEQKNEDEEVLINLEDINVYELITSKLEDEDFWFEYLILIEGLPNNLNELYEYQEEEYNKMGYYIYDKPGITKNEFNSEYKNGTTEVSWSLDIYKNCIFL